MSLLAVNVKAQTKGQSEIIKTEFKTGEYKIIAGGRGVMNITEIIPDKSQPEDNVEIVMQMWPDSPTESTREEREHFFADKAIYATNYMTTNYEGNKAMMESIGYYVRRGSYAGSRRLVFLNGKVYILGSWKSKDDYEISYVLEPKTEKKPGKKKKKKGGFFKKLKQELLSGSSSGGGSDDYEATQALKKDIQPYLDAASAEQKKMEATPKAKKIAAKNAEMKKEIDNFIDNYNNVFFENKTGRTIYIYEDDSNRAGRYGDGVKVRLPCTGVYYYDFTGKRFYYPNDVILLHRGYQKKCGKTVQIK